MLKQLKNEAFCTLRITTTGPLLIKSGYASVSGPDMTPVLTWRENGREVFMPGSSLKGVFRSHLEKIACSLRPHVVCYPFESNEGRQADSQQRRNDYRDSCGGLFTQIGKRGNVARKWLEDNSDLVYEASCPTCRLFGSTGFIGRIAISDAYLTSDTEEKKERRDGIGIDRLTGGASHGAKFELEVVSSGVSFETTIHLRNFEIWQLGMLFAVLQDMEDELIRVGSGRSRGLGQVKAEISDSDTGGRPGGFVVSTLRETEEPLEQLWGLGRWLNNGSYGTWQNDYIDLKPRVEKTPHGIRALRVFGGTDLTRLRDAAIEQFVKRIKEWPEAPEKKIIERADSRS